MDGAASELRDDVIARERVGVGRPEMIAHPVPELGQSHPASICRGRIRPAPAPRRETITFAHAAPLAGRTHPRVSTRVPDANLIVPRVCDTNVGAWG